MAQQQFVNGEALSVHRGKQNANALDTVSKSDTTDQALASNIAFATGKGPKLGGGTAVLDKYDPTESVVTLAPSGTGSITLSNNTLSTTKLGRMIFVTGAIDVASTTSPLGTYLILGGLPAIADLTDKAGNFGTTAIIKTGGGSFIVAASMGDEGATTLEIQRDPATMGGGDSISFDFFYVGV